MYWVMLLWVGYVGYVGYVVMGYVVLNHLDIMRTHTFPCKADYVSQRYHVQPWTVCLYHIPR